MGYITHIPMGYITHIPLRLYLQVAHLDGQNENRVEITLKAGVFDSMGSQTASAPILKWGGPDTPESLQQGSEELLGRFAGFLQAGTMPASGQGNDLVWNVKTIPARPPERAPQPEPENSRFAKGEEANDKDSLKNKMRTAVMQMVGPTAAEVIDVCASIAYNFPIELNQAALASALGVLDLVQTEEDGQNIVRARRVAPAVLDDEEAQALRVARGMA